MEQFAPLKKRIKYDEIYRQYHIFVDIIRRVCCINPITYFVVEPSSDYWKQYFHYKQTVPMGNGECCRQNRSKQRVRSVVFAAFPIMKRNHCTDSMKFISRNTSNSGAVSSQPPVLSTLERAIDSDSIDLVRGLYHFLTLLLPQLFYIGLSSCQSWHS